METAGRAISVTGGTRKCLVRGSTHGVHNRVGVIVTESIGGSTTATSAHVASTGTGTVRVIKSIILEGTHVVTLAPFSGTGPMTRVLIPYIGVDTAGNN